METSKRIRTSAIAVMALTFILLQTAKQQRVLAAPPTAAEVPTSEAWASPGVWSAGHGLRNSETEDRPASDVTFIESGPPLRAASAPPAKASAKVAPLAMPAVWGPVKNCWATRTAVS